MFLKDRGGWGWRGSGRGVNSSVCVEKRTNDGKCGQRTVLFAATPNPESINCFDDIIRRVPRIKEQIAMLPEIKSFTLPKVVTKKVNRFSLS